MVALNFDEMFEASTSRTNTADAENPRNRIYANDFVVASIKNLSAPLIVVGQLEVTPEGEMWVAGQYIAGLAREDNSLDVNPEWVNWLKLAHAPKVTGSGTLNVPALRAHDYLGREITFKTITGEILTETLTSYSNHGSNGILKLGVGMDDYEVFYGSPIIVFYP